MANIKKQTISFLFQFSNILNLSFNKSSNLKIFQINLNLAINGKKFGNYLKKIGLKFEF